MSGGAPVRWIVAGGGTGGHVTPALALAERIAARGDEVLVLGAARGLEARLVAVAAIGRACFSAAGVLRRTRADLVVSVGGYASVPAVIAAALLRIPVALVEPNAVPGRANRAAARLARRIFVQFDAAAAVFARAVGAERVRTPGIPLRKRMVEAFARQDPRRTPAPPFRLLVFGGSQGAHQINQAMIEAAPSLDPTRLEIFHQTGEADRETVTAAYAAAGLRAEVVAFEPDMPSRYRWADLSLCRAGALTVAELAMSALPALLVPYPHAADDHQRANAEALAAAGAGRLLDSRPLASSEVLAAIHALLEKPAELQEMSACAAKLARPDAAERIVEECAALLDGGRER